MATIPLPPKGPIQVNLNDPANVSISIATLPTNTTPDVQEWNLQLEHQIGNNMTFSMAYVGDKGTHLTTYYNYNRQQYALAPCSVTAPAGCNFPHLGAINTQATIGNFDITTLFKSSLNRRFTAGLQFGASYTWSHAIDDSPDAFDTYGSNGGTPVNYRDLAAERASSDYDMRNRFVLSTHVRAAVRRWPAIWQQLEWCDQHNSGRLADKPDLHRAERHSFRRSLRTGGIRLSAATWWAILSRQQQSTPILQLGGLRAGSDQPGAWHGYRTARRDHTA